ncbi:hypothetical protein ACFXAF_12410 [Kitasatospora sp. NPDC059463]|uniref:hypothetical protein n=1 Tax=unclassified Kitasatospora TaxID=2633591 RepID=UPI00369DDDBC
MPDTARYSVTSRVGHRAVAYREPLADPFVRHTIVIGWPDLLRGLLRRRLEVTVTVDGDRDAIRHVLNLPTPERN